MRTTAEEALEQLSRMNRLLSSILEAKTKLPPSYSQAQIEEQRALVRRLHADVDFAARNNYWDAQRALEAAQAKLKHMEEDTAWARKADAAIYQAQAKLPAPGGTVSHD